jgi:dihydropyrimidinase
VWGDINSDGRPDFARNTSGRIEIYLNNGPATTTWGCCPAGGVAWSRFGIPATGNLVLGDEHADHRCRCPSAADKDAAITSWKPPPGRGPATTRPPWLAARDTRKVRLAPSRVIPLTTRGSQSRPKCCDNLRPRPPPCGAFMTTLIKNGTIVTASDRYDADIYIDKGVVSLIGQGLNLPAETIVDASGKLVMPGGIDVHTHLDMPFGGTTSADDFETGTIAAAHGGTTTLIDFAIQSFGEGLYPAFEAWMKKAEGRSVIDYAFHMIVRELTDPVSHDMDKMVRHEGVTSFKLFMAYPGVFMVDDATIFRALLRTRENGGLVCMHAENGGVIDTLVKDALRKGQTAPKYHALTRPTRAEGEATGRAIALAEMAGVPIYIVHLSCSDALEKVKQARDMGLPAYAETCPQYLFLSYDDYERPGFEGAKYVMSPPLREKWNQDALWKGLQKNDLQVVSTDHCPFCMNDAGQKPLGKDDFSKIPNGAPGIETRLVLVWDGGVRTGRIDVHRFVELMSTSPAKMFGLWPKKGTVAVGSDGDLVLWDPEKETTLSAKTHHMKVDYNPYEGRTVKGGPAVVLSRGEVIVDHGEFKGKSGRGQFVKRQAGRPLVA